MDWNQILNNFPTQDQYVNLSATDNCKVRDLKFNDFSVSVRYHPEYSKSILSDISNSIGKDCYFCKKLNNSNEKIPQLHGEYFVLQIPYSFFLKQFLVFDYKHKRKVRTGRIFDILFFAEQFKEYIVISDGLDIPLKDNYHFYMQLINQQSLPIEKDCKNDKLLYEIFKCEDGYVGLLNNYLRGTVIIRSKNKQWIANIYFEIEKLLGRSYTFGKSPYLNVIGWKNDNEWELVIFPRVVLRPTQYYEQGRGKINIVPGAIEMGGVFFMSEASNLDNLSSEIITDIYSQVSYSFNHLKEIIMPLIQNI